MVLFFRFQLEYPIPIPKKLTSEMDTFRSYTIDTDVGSDVLRITPDNRHLIYKETFDADDFLNTSSFSMTILASTMFGTERKITIELNVQDVNDNAPVVESSLLTLFASKSKHTAGSIIGQIKARDFDKGDNARLSYILVSSTAPNAEILV